MPKQIRLNAFDMNCVGHQSPGLWTHPRDRADRYNTLDYDQTGMVLDVLACRYARRRAAPAIKDRVDYRLRRGHAAGL